MPIRKVIAAQGRKLGRPVLRHSPAARRLAGNVRAHQGAAAIEASGRFDRRWYELATRRTFANDSAAISHYLDVGRFADLSPHPLYEPTRHIKDDARRLAPSSVPFAQFLRTARRPRAVPHPLFSPARYLAANPGAAKHPLGAWGHFLATATDDTPLPLPEALPDVRVTWGQWREAVTRHLGRWAEQSAIFEPSRTRRGHDARAEQRLRAELAAAADAGMGATAAAAGDGVDAGTPIVSIITAVRNRPQQVLEAIASVSAQTRDDWELIVVDDGSDDATPQAVEEVARQDPRVRLVRRERSGVSAARNAGAALARGRYVAWLDSDNTWRPEFLELMLAVAARRGARALYSAVEMITDEGPAYREFAGTLEHLAVGNFVDLNVLVVERTLLEEVGGFDDALPRAVDYDLVYKIAKRTELVYVPFIGVTYSDDTADPDRISVRQLRTWNYVVRDRHVIDWQRLADGASQRVADRISVVITGRRHWEQVWASVAAVLANTPGADLEIVVVDSASPRADSLLIGAVEAIDPRVRVVRTVANYNLGPGRNVGLAHSTGATVIFLTPGTEVTRGWLEPLLGALEGGDVVVAAPLLLAHDELIRSAGLVLPAHCALPIPLLAGHPPRDARGLPAMVDVPAVSAGALAVRARDLIAVHGFDPLYVDFLDDADACLRVSEAGRTQGRHAGRVVVVPASRARQPATHRPRPDALTVQNRRLFAERWRSPHPRGEELWHAAGLAPQAYLPVGDGYPEDVGELRPVLSKVAAGPRWALELPDDAAGDPTWAQAAQRLADALERAGGVAVTRRTSVRAQTPWYLDDVVVVLRGAAVTVPLRGRTSVLLSGRAAPPLAAEAERYDAALNIGDGSLAGALLDDPVGAADLLVKALAGLESPQEPAPRAH